MKSLRFGEPSGWWSVGFINLQSTYRQDDCDEMFVNHYPCEGVCIKQTLWFHVNQGK
jgi:hypothetical protein